MPVKAPVAALSELVCVSVTTVVEPEYSVGSGFEIVAAGLPEVTGTAVKAAVRSPVKVYDWMRLSRVLLTYR